MEKKIVNRTVNYTDEVYVAKDGKEFASQRTCKMYEEDLERDECLARPDVLVNKKMNGVAPINAEYGGDDFGYLWVKALSEEAVQALKKAYEDGYGASHFEVGRWVCIETTDCYETYLYGEEEMMEITRLFFGDLGISVSFEYNGEDKE